MRMDNIFRFGSQVSGESFLGRQELVRDLTSRMQCRDGGKGVAVLGMNRIGKSSLVEEALRCSFDHQPNVLVIRSTVNGAATAALFWRRLLGLAEEELMKKNVEDRLIDAKLRILRSTASMAFPLYLAELQEAFLSVMKRLRELGWWVILVLDEFDMARELFQRDGSLAVIRDLATLSSVHLTVVTISRRRLSVIEHQANEAASTLDGAFDKLRVAGFDEMDLMEYWGALTNYDIYYTPALAERLQYYTGSNPYLLSLFGNRMADLAMQGREITAETVDAIHQGEYGVNVEPYYAAITDRMIEDDYAGILRGILCGPMNNLRKSDLEVLQGGGYLNIDDQGYYCISRDFTTYFIERTQNLEMPLWDCITTTEQAVREIVGQIYPRFRDIHCSLVEQTVHGSVFHTPYPEVQLDVSQILRYGADQLAHGRDPSILDVMTFRFLVDSILRPHWKKFRKWFEDKEQKEWGPQFDLILQARNSLAHSHPEYLSSEENRLLPIYCTQVLTAIGHPV